MPPAKNLPCDVALSPAAFQREIESHWVGPTEAGHLLNVTPLRVTQLCNEGKLDSVRLDRGRLIARASLERLLQERAKRKGRWELNRTRSASPRAQRARGSR